MDTHSRCFIWPPAAKYLVNESSNSTNDAMFKNHMHGPLVTYKRWQPGAPLPRLPTDGGAVFGISNIPDESMIPSELGDIEEESKKPRKSRHSVRSVTKMRSMEHLNVSTTQNSKRFGKGKGSGKIKTELIKMKYKSEHKILHGFWMQGDFFVLVTHDITNNGYYLELFQYDSPEQEDKYELF